MSFIQNYIIENASCSFHLKGQSVRYEHYRRTGGEGKRKITSFVARRAWRVEIFFGREVSNAHALSRDIARTTEIYRRTGIWFAALRSVYALRARPFIGDFPRSLASWQASSGNCYLSIELRRAIESPVESLRDIARPRCAKSRDSRMEFRDGRFFFFFFYGRRSAIC